MKYKPYRKYKHSGIEWLGEIPEDWEVKRLKYFTKVNPPKSELSGISKNTEVSFLPMENISETGTLDLSVTKKISEVINGYSYLRDHDVIIAKITPCFENGKGAIAKDLVNGIAFATTEVITLRPNHSDSSKYLYYLLFCSPFRKYAEGTMYGAGGQKRIADSFVANYHFSLPPLPEQKAIAEFLDRETAKIDGLIERQEKLIELLQEKRQALISAVVTGKKPLPSSVRNGRDRSPQDRKMKDSGVEWLGEIPEDWEVKRLKHVTDYISDGSHFSPPIQDEGKNYISVKDLKNNGSIDFENCSKISNIDFIKLEKTKCRPKMNDILFSKDGTIGKVAIVPKNNDFVILSSLALIRPNILISPLFLKYYISSINGLQQMESYYAGSALKRITLDIIVNLFIPLPPLPEQKAIAEFLDGETARIDALVEKAKISIELSKEKRQALISAVVTGKIRVTHG